MNVRERLATTRLAGQGSIPAWAAALLSLIFAGTAHAQAARVELSSVNEIERVVDRVASKVPTTRYVRRVVEDRDV